MAGLMLLGPLGIFLAESGISGLDCHAELCASLPQRLVSIVTTAKSLEVLLAVLHFFNCCVTQ